MAVLMYKKSSSFEVQKVTGSQGEFPMPDKTDIEIFIKLLKSGQDIDEQIFIKVYHVIQKWFRKYLCTSDEDEYLEMIDEAITRLLERRKDFRGNSPGELYSYIRSILRTITDSEKSKNSRLDCSDQLEQMRDERIDQAETCMKNAEYEDLYDCVGKLPTSQRRIALELLAGTKKGTIAHMMQITPSVLSRNIQKILLMLRECLLSKGYARQFEFGV